MCTATAKSYHRDMRGEQLGWEWGERYDFLLPPKPKPAPKSHLTPKERAWLAGFPLAAALAVDQALRAGASVTQWEPGELMLPVGFDRCALKNAHWRAVRYPRLRRMQYAGSKKPRHEYEQK